MSTGHNLPLKCSSNQGPKNFHGHSWRRKHKGMFRMRTWSLHCSHACSFISLKNNLIKAIQFYFMWIKQKKQYQEQLNWKVSNRRVSRKEFCHWISDQLLDASMEGLFYAGFMINMAGINRHRGTQNFSSWGQELNYSLNTECHFSKAQLGAITSNFSLHVWP